MKDFKAPLLILSHALYDSYEIRRRHQRSAVIVGS